MDELTPTQISHLREKLEALRIELQRMLDSSEEGAQPVDLDEPIGRLSRMEAMQQSKMAAANRNSAKRRIQLVGDALVRLTKNPERFGECMSCEEPIAFKRLAARPETRLCLNCQGSRENQ